MRANCVICSDFFDESNPVSAAPCGHVYHSSCLSLWIAQSRTCPQCRSRITGNNILKLYFNFPPSSTSNSSELENEILNLKAQLSAKIIELETCKKERDDTVAFVRLAEKKASELQQAAYKSESEVSELRLRVKSYSKLESKLLKFEQMNATLTNDLQLLDNVQIIIKGTQKDVENILREYSCGSEATKQLATYCTCLKRELQKVMDSKSKLVELNSKLKCENGRFAAKVKFYEEALATSSSEVSKPALKEDNFSSAKRIPLFELNDSPVASTSVNSSYRSSREDISMDVSPLSVAFAKSKFNMCITSSTTSVSCKVSNSDDDIQFIGNPYLPIKKQNDDNSIIRTGYNGLGGHSNFIKSTSEFKKVKSLKRKV